MEQLENGVNYPLRIIKCLPAALIKNEDCENLEINGMKSLLSAAEGSEK
jgi:hypothetical protein